LPDPTRGIRVRTFLDPSRDAVCVEIRDDGVGIEPEHLPRLTDPFFTTKRDSGGTGLGLAVSAGIVKDHGGTLEFESTLGLGTAARVHLPLAAKERA
jgi:polar amino acid transport system substrate-binding protein